MTSKTVNCSVLVIDDERDLCRTIRMALEPAGYRVREAYDGRAGLDAIMESLPDLIICDIKLPGLNGFELIAEAHKRRADLKSVPFVMLSGLDDEMTMRAGFKLGASGYLTKPFKPAALRDTIARLLNRESPSDTIGPALDEKPMDGRPSAPIKAHVRLISLEEVIQELGAEWPKVCQKAMMIAEGVVRKSLERGDSVSQSGENGFTIAFKDNDPVRIRARLDVMEINIRQRLLGGSGAIAQAFRVDGTVERSPSNSEPRSPDSKRSFDPALAMGMPQESGDPLAKPDVGWLARQIKVFYRPIWYSGSKSVVAYQAYPMRKTRYGNYVGAKVLHGGPTDPEALELDLLVIAKVLEQMEQMSAGDDAAMVSVPLHFSSLRADARDHIGEALAGCPPAMTRRMILEISELPDIRGEMTVRWGMNFLRQFTDLISARVMPDDRHARLFAQNGASVFQMDLDDRPETLDPAVRAERIRSFVKAARQLGPQIRIDGIAMIDDFKAARAAKADFMCGPTIGWTSECPRQTYPLDELQILGM